MYVSYCDFQLLFSTCCNQRLKYSLHLILFTSWSMWSKMLLQYIPSANMHFSLKQMASFLYPRTKFTFSFTCTHVAFKNHFVSVCTTRNLIKWTLRPRVWKLLTIYHHQFIHVRTSLLSAANIFQQAFQWRPVLLILAKNFWIISENEQNVKDEYLSMSFPDYFDSIDYLFICPVDVN